MSEPPKYMVYHYYKGKLKGYLSYHLKQNALEDARDWEAGSEDAEARIFKLEEVRR